MNASVKNIASKMTPPSITYQAPANANWFTGLHPAVRNTMVIAGTAITLFVLYKGYGAYTTWRASQSGKKEVSAVQDSLTALQSQGISASFPDSQYDSWANELKVAMNGCGTNQNTVNDIMTKLDNDADVYKLITAYGTQTLAGCSFFTSGITGSLAEAFSYKSMVDPVNAIFKNHGILYRF